MRKRHPDDINSTMPDLSTQAIHILNESINRDYDISKASEFPDPSEKRRDWTVIYAKIGRGKLQPMWISVLLDRFHDRQFGEFLPHYLKRIWTMRGLWNLEGSMELSPFTGQFYGRDKIRFLRGCIRHPRQFGAVAPSGRKLATAMAGEIDLGVPGVVVELGAGTGPITKALLEAGVTPENLILIERDPHLCQLLASRFKGVRVWCGDAADLPRLLREAKIDRIKTVVSGLPLLAMTEGVRKHIIEAIFTALPANGQFLQFTYGLKEPVPEKIRMQLKVAGVRCQWILSNLPPATIWCYRPQEG